MERSYENLAFILLLASAVGCGLLHVATFVTIVPPVFGLVPFFLMAGAMLCARAARVRICLTVRDLRYEITRGVLVAYALFTFAYVFRVTDGATSVSTVGGQYFAMYKSQVIKTITEQEFRMFPNLTTRVMSAWCGMMSSIGISYFAG